MDKFGATIIDAIKTALVNAPVLHLPDFSKQFTVETDACHNGIGAVLMQEGHLIAFLSKALGPQSQGMSTYEKECMVMLMAIKKWRPYLQHQEFVIKIDHQSLAHLSDQKLTTPIQQKAFITLLGLQYKKGSTNQAADALSRYFEIVESNDISTCVPKWKAQLITGYADDPQAQQLITSLVVQ